MTRELDAAAGRASEWQRQVEVSCLRLCGVSPLMCVAGRGAVYQGRGVVYRQVEVPCMRSRIGVCDVTDLCLWRDSFVRVS